MAVATLFDNEKSTSPAQGRRGTLLSLLTGGFGAAEDAPDVQEAPAYRPYELGLRDYLRGLELMIQRTERAQISRTLVTVTPKEIQTLVEKTAKAKARYLAATLEIGDGEAMPDSTSIKAMEAARERHEALEAGLRTLLGELRAGNIQVDGVVDDPPEEPANPQQ
ncbi:hypothetical protein [Ferruginivarius sediminum]|uniref:Uncharacterized protein n=1 Tax=Ferruginivarius sediminum TaxID=2661937 RepID=A0A369TBF1_9PROT|nr:hypothetical protein [Ferruginivarius sediminum]RDD61715.1 hypothetical protein DRB17_10990 [Ferruginivarius sediminum]